MKLRVSSLTLCGAMGFVIGCGNQETGPDINGLSSIEVASVRIQPSIDTIAIPDTARPTDRVTLQGTVFGRTGAAIPGARFVWRSSDPSIATVDNDGVVQALRVGKVDITASASKVAHATIVVVPATSSVSISPTVDTIFVDAPIVPSQYRQQFTASATDASGQPLTGVRYTWQSSAPATAAVDAAGLASAQALGTTTITVQANGKQASAALNVLPVVQGVTVTSLVMQVLALDTVQLAAVASDYSNKPMTRTFAWTSSAPNVATVDTTGRVLFAGAGTVTFTATTAFRSNSVTITAFPRSLLRIESGTDFGCGTTALGRGYCWGRGETGQLASPPDSVCYESDAQGGFTAGCTLEPKRFAGPTLEFQVVAAGDVFGCGVTTQQLLYCWGSDGDGEIGNGGKGGGPVPRLATVGSERFTAVTAGGAHACALNLAGDAYCWGRDHSGQLGDHRRINSTTPVPVVSASSKWTRISAGNEHTCGIDVTGRALCWGDGTLGQTGHGVQDVVDVPIPVASGETFAEISAGFNHTCGVTTGGDVYCWGYNESGQLGTVTNTNVQVTPVLVGSGYRSVSAGNAFTCAVTVQNEAMCWGSNAYGQLGSTASPANPFGASFTPVSVQGGLSFATLSAGGRHVCGITVAGEAYCWGSNIFGALGDKLQAAVGGTPQLMARPR